MGAFSDWMHLQCSKLRVRTAPGAHISVDGRTFFCTVRPVCARGVHGQAAGCTFYEPVRPDGAQNKTLISNTDLLMVISFQENMYMCGFFFCRKFSDMVREGWQGYVFFSLVIEICDIF